jgi:hypothetical protein
LPSLYERANTTTQITPATLLANDIHPDVNDPLTLSSVSATSTQGAVVTLTNGTVVYDPRQVAALTGLDEEEFGTAQPDRPVRWFDTRMMNLPRHERGLRWTCN